MIKEALPQDIAFDIETYPNTFTAVFWHMVSDTWWMFEISDRVNQSKELYDFLYTCQGHKMRMVGFNNVGFDYPVIHEFANLYSAQGTVSAAQLYAKAMEIIGSENRWSNIIWPNHRLVPQLDLFLIHHFDNMAKSTSLKALEINMRSDNVEDLPFDPSYPLTVDQIPKLLSYNVHDVFETGKFYEYSLPAIETRRSLTEKLGQDFTNHNDTKIGKEFFIMELEKVSPGICFDRSTGRKKPRQTPRPNGIPLNDVIFPYVEFKNPEFRRVLDYLRTVTIRNTKSAPELDGLHATINGFQFDFGTGGIHGSISKQVVRSDETHVIIDADVTSFYPNLAIKNRVFPAHLSELFCNVYEDLFNTRKTYPKKSAENLLYKLALNGVYGDSNNVYGPFLDPKYTMTITVNGQLSLCMCAERIIDECEAEMIQANTDGFTVRIPRTKVDRYYEICKDWEALTKLDLEFAEYDGMWIRDVNSYIARTTDGKVKRVGAYQYVTPYHVEEFKKTPERGWHQNHSAMVIPKAAEAVMLRGENLHDFIRNHADPFDFMIRAKVPRSSRLVLSDGDFPKPIREKLVDGKAGRIIGYSGSIPNHDQIQNISRYYISTDGRKLIKIMPPTAKSVVDKAPDIVDLNPRNERYIGIDTEWTVSVCNDVKAFSWSNINYDYYIKEAEKLILTSANDASNDLFEALN